MDITITSTLDAGSGAATLSSATASANGALEYSASVSTDMSGGMLHWMITQDATPRAASIIKKWGASRVSATGTQNVSGYGPAGVSGIAYYVQFVQIIDGTESNVLVTASTFTMTITGAPTMAEVRMIGEYKPLTQPDWMTEGRAGKDPTVDALPPGATYNAGANEVQVASGATVASLDGFDFLPSETSLVVAAGGTIQSLTNCRFGYPRRTHLERYNFISGITQDPAPCLELQTSVSAQAALDYMARVVFDGSGNGAGSGVNPQGWLRAVLTSSGGTFYHANVGLMEFIRIVGFDSDGWKAPCGGTRRAIYYDSPMNAAWDATPYVAGTYNRGDFIYRDDVDKYMRICKVDGTTSTPDWSSKLASTAEWQGFDPHTDHETHNSSPIGVLSRWEWCYYNRKGSYRMFAADTPAHTCNAALLCTSNSGGSNQTQGPLEIEYSIFTEDADDPNQNHVISIGGNGGTVVSADVSNNWYDGTKWVNDQTGGSVTEANNSATFVYADPAVLSNVSASWIADVLSYEFDSDGNGWMAVVVSTSNTLTDDEVWAAEVGGTISSVTEVNCQAGGAGIADDIAAALPAGTYYVHGLFQRGGGVRTRAATQSVVIP